MAGNGQLKAIDRIHAGLPALACKGLCSECCGPVFMSKPEWGRIVGRIGHVPKGDASLICPMLDGATKRCTVYAIRPTICRIWGLVKSMACPHGCKPSRWLTDAEANAVLAKVRRIGATPYGGPSDGHD